MATVYYYLPGIKDFYEDLQDRINMAEVLRLKRYKAIMLCQSLIRSHLIKNYMIRLSYYARIIQCAFRKYLGKKRYRRALKRVVQINHATYYARAVGKIQALWRGYYSRRTKFNYHAYRHWLSAVKERGERRAAEIAEYRIRSRADDLRILEAEARQWLAFVVFKLHHLLRTYVCSGVYSQRATTELSEFEKLLKSIQYLEYMKRLKKKYDEFVKKHQPTFSNKRLFPIIGDGSDYWYLSLAEMYELTSPQITVDYRHKGTHHSKIHKEPFLWRKVRPPGAQAGRGPFKAPKPPTRQSPPPPAPTPMLHPKEERPKDPRFHIYVKYYRPDPALFEYVNFHINVLTKRKCSIEGLHD